MDEERQTEPRTISRLENELFLLQLGVGAVAVLLVVACFLLWRILDAVS